MTEVGCMAAQPSPASLYVDLYFQWKPTSKVNQADKLCLARALVNGGWIRQGISYKQQETDFRFTNQQPTVQSGLQAGTNNSTEKIYQSTTEILK